MAFLDLLKRLPGAPIGLGVLKKEFQIRAGERGIAFDEQHHIATCALNLPPKVVIALGRIARDQAAFAERLGQERFERTDFIMLDGNGTLLQHYAGLRLIHMQHLLLWVLSPIGLLASASQGFAIHRQMHVPPAWLYR